MKESPQIRWMRRTTLLCLVLLCMSGAAQALHNHAQDLVRGDTPEKTRCTICVADHAPQQVAVRMEILPAPSSEFAAPLQETHRVATVTSDATRIRPPPTSL